MTFMLNEFDKTKFQEDLIGWFEQEQRDLPWRKDQDPYKVWVSEIMLQQTRVDTVIPYFNNFIAKFPTLQALADADEDEVLKAWEGLGYYSRARNLQAAVREVQESYGGKVPDTPEDISKLKGVGPYTAGAILSIAYGVPEPAVDGNVMRVFSRILTIWEDIAKPKTRKIFEEAVRQLISKENPSYFNQALMELGALICVPGNPACLLCPVQEHCQAFKEGVQRELPVKTTKKSSTAKTMAAVVLADENGKYLIHKRPNEGLLANLWEFPNCETVEELKSEKEQLEYYILEEYGVKAEIGDFIGSIQHVFSHLVWNISVFKGVAAGHVNEQSDLRLVTEDELSAFAFPVSHQRIWKGYKNET